MNKTAIVLGATGVVGRELVALLSQHEQIDKVIAITRRPIAYNSKKITNHVVDFSNLEQFSTAFQGDILLSCLGTTLKQAGSIEQQRVVDVSSCRASPHQWRKALLTRLL